MSMLSRFATLGGEPGDPYWANVSYLLVGNGANGTTTNIKDSSSNNIATTIFGNTVISTTQSKYGSGSVYFDGNGDYLRLSSGSQFSFGTGDFTVEGWFYQTAVNTYPLAFEIDHLAPGGIAFFLSNGSIIQAYYTVSGGVGGFMGSANAPSLNTWNHIAWVKNGTSFKIYVNGVAGANSTYPASLSVNGANEVFVGSHGGVSAYYFSGYIYDLRITKGVARYTANFTPPTAAMPTY